MGVVALVVAIVIASVLTATAPTPEPKRGSAPRIAVPVMEVRPIEVARQWGGQGVIAAVDRADVPARIAAVVASIPEGIDAGQRVAAGQVLAELDPIDFEHQARIAVQNVADLTARLRQLTVQQVRLEERRALEERLVEIAGQELERVRRIYENQASTQQELDRATRGSIEAQRALNVTLEQLDALGPQGESLVAQRAAQEAALEQARTNLGRAQITSPIAGIIESLDVKPGESLSPGQRVARVVGLSRVEVALNVPASARADVAVGDRVVLRSASRAERDWVATISRVLPQDDATTRTAAFFAEVQQPDAAEQFGTPAGQGLLTPGTFVSGIVTSDRRQERMVIPRRSVRNGRVLLVEDGVIVSRSVVVDYTFEGTLPQTGLADDQWVVLRTGGSQVAAGDLLVLNVSVTLPDGALVEPTVESTPPQPEAPR